LREHGLIAVLALFFRMQHMAPRKAGRLLQVRLFSLSWAMFLTAAASGISGCKESSPPNAVPMLPANTPEAKLEEVMARLRTAVVDAAAAQGSGVVSQRKVSHRLIPPTDGQDSYKAEITIRTTVALANAPAASSRPKKEEPQDEQLDPFDEDDEMQDPLLEDLPQDEEANDAELEEPTDNGVTRRAVEQSRETTTKVYDLVYENERWDLVDEISVSEDEVAKYLFEYALEE
jgi:hypothetical protein